MSKTDPPGNGFVAGMPGTAARTRAEGAIESLRKRGGVFVEAVRATRMPMVLTDPNLPGNPIVFANEAFLDLSGCRMDEVLGQQPHFMNGAGTDPQDAARFEEPLRADQDDVIETIQYRKDGSRFVATVLLSAFKSDDGRVLNHFMSWLDVTRQVEAEDDAADLRRTQKALQKSEDRLAADLAAMEELQRVSLELVGELEPQALYDRILDAAILLMRSDAASIQRLLPDRKELKLLGQHGFHPEATVFWDMVHVDNDSACARALKSYERILLHDIEDVVEDSGDLKAYRLSGLRSVQTTPLRARGGQVVGMLSTLWTEPHTPPERDLRFFDILARLAADVLDRVEATEELRASEAALRESETRLAAAFESVPAGLAIIDLSGKVIVANGEYRRFVPTGVIPSRDAERGKHWQAWDEEGRLISRQDYPGSRALLGERVIPGMDLLYTDDDGRAIWTSVACAPILDPAGKTAAIVSVISDIDERKRGIEALRESEERLRAFGEASQDVLWIREAETLQWTYLTPAFEAIYGLSREEATSGDNYRSWLDLILPEDREWAHQCISQVGDGGIATFEYRIRRPADGTIHWLRNTDFPIRDASGRVTHIGGVGTDITQRKRDEERQKHLLAELQHRVRNTLAVVKSISQRTAESSISVEEMAAHLGGRLDAFARVQSAVTRNPIVGVKLRSLIDDELLAHAAHEGGGITVEGPDVALRPKAAESVSLALHELATNSVKHGALACNDGGRIAITWNLDGQASNGGGLDFEWLENSSDGKLPKPSRHGFGMELLTRILPYDLGAKTNVEFRDDGLRFTMDLPGEHITDGGQ